MQDSILDLKCLNKQVHSKKNGIVKKCNERVYKVTVSLYSKAKPCFLSPKYTFT